MRWFSIKTAVIRWIIGALIGATMVQEREPQAILYGALMGFLGGVIVDLEAYRTWLEGQR